MANTRISDLTASASNLASTDLAPVVQTVGVGPVKMTGLQLAGGLLGSTTFNGSTVTTSSPVLNLTQTWNAGAVTFTGLKFNATDTASASGSLLLDLQVGTVSKFSVSKAGEILIPNGQVYRTDPSTASGFGGGANPTIQANNTIYSFNNYAGIGLPTGYALYWSSNGSSANLGTRDLFLTRAAAATLQLGAADAAAPVAQTLQVQSVVAGTSNTAGANFTINGSKGTGTGAGGSIIFQVAPAGSSGTAQNAYSTALTIDSTRLAAFGGSIQVPNAATLSNVAFTAAIYFGSGDLRLYTNASSSQFAYFNSPSQLLLGANTRLAWNNGVDSGTNSADTILTRDGAPNTLALRNSTAAQLFRVYSTYNGTNDAYGAIGAGVKLDGTYASGDENILYIGSQKKGSPTALTKLAIQVDGTTQLDYASTTASAWSSFSNWNIRPASGASSTTYWYAGSAYVVLGCSGGTDSLINGSAFGDTCIRSNAKNILLSADTGTTYALRINSSNLLQFQGTTSSFPALKRSTTTLQVRLADDTGFGSFQTGGFSGGAPTIKTANYTQLEADYSLIFNGTGSITLTLLAAATYPGKILYVKTIAAQTVVSASSNVKPIDTDTAGTAILAATAGKWAMLQSDGTDWVIMAQG